MDKAERIAWGGFGATVAVSLLGFVLAATVAPGAINMGIGVGIAALMLLVCLLIYRRTNPLR